MIRGPSLFLFCGGFLFHTLLPLTDLHAQVGDTVGVKPSRVQESQSDSVAPPGRISPRGAFLRSIAVPGWGHAEVGSYLRGGFYFAAQSATAFMLWKTDTRLARARDRRALMESVVRARLQNQGITDPLELQAALEEEPAVADLAGLVEARSDQREDWIALGIFLLLLGGADAYVSAHLADFPSALEIEGTPGGGVEVGFSFPVGR